MSPKILNLITRLELILEALEKGTDGIHVMRSEGPYRLFCTCKDEDGLLRSEDEVFECTCGYKEWLKNPPRAVHTDNCKACERKKIRLEAIEHTKAAIEQAKEAKRRIIHLADSLNTPHQAQIVGVAVQYQDLIFFLPKPNRHPHILHKMHEMGLPASAQREQGFILDDGSYLDRETSGKLALQNGQITNMISPPWLTSEDLW